MRYGSEWSPCCRGGSVVFAIRAASGSLSGPRCRGSSSCCTRGSRGGICHWRLALGRARRVYRRLDEWQRAGVWERLHALLLAELQAAGEIEWSRAVADSSLCRRKRGAGTSPVHRGRNGSKHHRLPRRLFQEARTLILIRVLRRDRTRFSSGKRKPPDFRGLSRWAVLDSNQ
jgi:transposase